MTGSRDRLKCTTLNSEGAGLYVTARDKRDEVRIRAVCDRVLPVENCKQSW